MKSAFVYFLNNLSISNIFWSKFIRGRGLVSQKFERIFCDIQEALKMISHRFWFMVKEILVAFISDGSGFILSGVSLHLSGSILRLLWHNEIWKIWVMCWYYRWLNLVNGITKN